MSIKISQINQKQNINFRANAKIYSNIVSKVDSLSNSNQFKQNYQFVEKILEASQQTVFPQNFTFEKNQFILYKNVFPSSVFNGYEVYVNNLPLKENQSMLDMGCGCGVIGITALKKYKLNNVVCADINGFAVKNTRRNVHLNNLDNQVTVVQSNLFSNIDKNQRFDLIFWNPPYFDGEKKNGSILYKSMYDKDYKNIKKFIIEGQAYLNKNGKITQRSDDRWIGAGADPQFCRHGRGSQKNSSNRSHPYCGAGTGAHRHFLDGLYPQG